MFHDDCPNDRDLAAMIVGDQPSRGRRLDRRPPGEVFSLESRAQRLDDAVDPVIASLRKAVAATSHSGSDSYPRAPQDLHVSDPSRIAPGANPKTPPTKGHRLPEHEPPSRNCRATRF